MKNMFFVFSIIFVVMISCEKKKWIYPETRVEDIVDIYFGDTVADPYRWLENDTSEEVKAWVDAENQLTQDYLQTIPFRSSLRERFTHIWDYPKYGTPFKKGECYFFFKNDGLQNQAVLYMQRDFDSTPEVLLDPNTFSDNGTVALSGFSFSKNNRYLAYQISKGGSDWNEIFVLDIENKKTLPDHIEWCKFTGVSWLGDGFFYSAYTRPEKGKELTASNEYHKVYYHCLGEKQSQDKVVYEDVLHPQLTVSFDTDDDENYIFLSKESGTTFGNMLYVKPARDSKADFVPIFEDFGYDFIPIDIIEHKILVRTNYKAPKYRLVLIDPAYPEEASWTEVLPESETVLSGCTRAGGKLVAFFIRDARSEVIVYDEQGHFLYNLPLPTLGTLGGFAGNKNDNIAFFSFSSYAFPTTIYKYDMETRLSEIFHDTEVDFDKDQYTTEQVFYPSKDGTMIPMFITLKKDVTLNGHNPLLLYGYGGFNISLTPSFGINYIPFLEEGGIYVVANLRGGGEYGQAWHEGGIKMQKQNVFDDFIAAAEWLIAQKYTSPDKLAIMGGSNGGLLVGACMTQRPDLFRVALPQVGVLDMLRYHKFTIGWAWASDYGTSDESLEMYRYLKGYSPIHHVKNGVNYPATLICTADHDDRVVPAHSFKFAATLQAKDSGKNPILIRIDTDAGHGAGKPTSKQIDEVVDRWAFTMYNLNMVPKFFSLQIPMSNH
ncbi:MAG: prolyl oligopeptidase family serine peptidase [Bacteroidales bacterium]|jgi:prolyl oligopeptidase|nr:prolyl oligopeptidase family serine peptidase [Bacteroidales bacterium]